jgi:uncharacterized protein (DUF305 family)
MMTRLFGFALLACILATGAPAFAQHADHSAHGETAAAPANSTEAFEAANAKMHRDMAIPFSGDADADFVRGMIPHHQGAIDMAKVVLQHGADPGIRKLARDIIAAQEKEIAWMKEWLAKNGK